ncbi:MAG: hypothetical protein N4J56_007609 [Chroococcidiopsis sp. SAG 2025]|nr:hypothetical protein [Chroococcidiopsis sp. SAG 2025]
MNEENKNAKMATIKMPGFERAIGDYISLYCTCSWPRKAPVSPLLPYHYPPAVTCSLNPLTAPVLDKFRSSNF